MGSRRIYALGHRNGKYVVSTGFLERFDYRTRGHSLYGQIQISKPRKSATSLFDHYSH